MDVKKLPEGLFCQSCGIPFDNEADISTKTDGEKNPSYCKYCFDGDAFTQPDLTMEQMIDNVVALMKHMDKADEAKLRELAESFMPHLKRWEKK